MATLQSNPLTTGLSGMLGRTIVFKKLRGKTIVANRPAPPSRQSEQQRINRSKFRSAAMWAHQVLTDAQRKAYYQQKATELNLPNAYTAAIADYMRSARISEAEQAASTTSFIVSKKDFELKKVEVIIKNVHSGTKEIRPIAQNEYDEWKLSLSEADLLQQVEVHVTHASNRVSVLLLNDSGG